MMPRNNHIAGKIQSQITDRFLTGRLRISRKQEMIASVFQSDRNRIIVIIAADGLGRKNRKFPASEREIRSRFRMLHSQSLSGNAVFERLIDLRILHIIRTDHIFYGKTVQTSNKTGHMILVDEFVKLQVSDEFLALFLVVIQLGAIMAVLILYFHKLNPFSPKKDAVEKKSTWRLWGMVAIGCIPAAVIGLLFDDLVNEYFYNKVTVAAMLILYGVVFIVLERRNRRRLREAEAALEAPRGRHARVSYGDVSDEAEASLFKITDVDEIDWKTALKIGCFQVLAIIPGTSRSGATIIGGMLAGCSRTAAAEFTFFLAIPIMFGWGLVKCIKFVAAGIAMTSTEILVLAVGIITAFAMSVVAIKFLMGYIKKNDFTAFGVYRIIVGLVVLAYFGVKVLL